MELEIDLFGWFAVRRDGKEVRPGDFGGRLARRVVRVLLTRRGEVVPRDVLVEALWGDRPPVDPAANLNVLVNRARRGLGDPALIETVPGGYAFRGGPLVRVDAERFGTHLRRARERLDRDDPTGALGEVDAALAVRKGEPLPEDAYTDWARPHLDRLERAHQDALELGARAALAAGDVQRAVAFAHEAVSRQPLREVAHLLLIRALAAGGDHAAALAAFEELRRRLGEELGIDPSREAADLQLRLLRGELSPTPDAGTGRTARAREAATAPLFVGREDELDRLSSLGPDTRVALVAGRAGSGKSRLLAELAAGTHRPALIARAVLPEREAPWSLTRALLRAAVDAGVDTRDVLPGRSVSALQELLPRPTGPASAYPATADPRTWRALVQEGTVRILEATGRSLLLIDDLQWADPSSLDLLTLVAARAEDLVLVLAYRPEEVATHLEVARFLTELRSVCQTVEVRPGPLDAASINRLLGDSDLAAFLAEHTDGTPFAVLEVIRALDGQGALRREGRGWRPVAPDVIDRTRAAARAGQQRSILARADRQAPAARELLNLLALLGRPAPARLLADATRTAAPRLIAELDNLSRAELVRHDSHGFAVAHDLVGETVRNRLNPVDRARLHLLLAQALDVEPAAPGERARHLAGAGDWPAASAAYARAARERLEHFADREAARLTEAGFQLDPADAVRAELLEVRAQTRERGGDLDDARDDLRSALALAVAGTDRSRLLARLATLASGSEDLLRASNLVDLALVEARDDAAARARALAVGAIVDMNLERASRAQDRYAEALALYERAGDARGVADILDAQAMAVFLDGEIASGIDAFDRVARMFLDSGNLLRVVTPRSTRGHGLVFGGMPVEGLADIEEAVDLARSLGYPEGEAYAQWHRSEALAACGRAGDAIDTAQKALSLAEDLGHRGWTATALRGLGIAHEADGDLQRAEEAFRRSLSTSERLPLFASWAHARLGLLLVSGGRLGEAADHVDRALATGPPLGRYEARLARCALAVAREEPNAPDLVADAIDIATRGGHRASVPPLAALREKIVGPR